MLRICGSQVASRSKMLRGASSRGIVEYVGDFGVMESMD